MTIEIDRDGWTNNIQVNISKTDASGCGHGYRLAGPKYNGSSTQLWSHPLTPDDATMALALLAGVDKAALDIERSNEGHFRVSLETENVSGWLTDPIGPGLHQPFKRVELDSYDLAEVRGYLAEVR